MTLVLLTFLSIQREWLELLLEELYSPHFGLFVKDETTSKLKISSTSCSVSNYLDYFKFLGRVHGLAIFHGLLMDPELVPLFYSILVSPVYKTSDSEKVTLLDSVGKVIRSGLCCSFLIKPS